MNRTGGYRPSAETLWYGENGRMYAHSSGSRGSPYSAIQDAPASSSWYRRMSSSGTWQTIAPNNRG